MQGGLLRMRRIHEGEKLLEIINHYQALLFTHNLVRVSHSYHQLRLAVTIHILNLVICHTLSKLTGLPPDL